ARQIEPFAQLHGDPVVEEGVRGLEGRARAGDAQIVVDSDDVDEFLVELGGLDILRAVHSDRLAVRAGQVSPQLPPEHQGQRVVGIEAQLLHATVLVAYRQLLRVLVQLIPGLRRTIRVEARLAEEAPVVDQTPDVAPQRYHV